MTLEKVEELCKKHGKSIEDFGKFIRGQTVGIVGGELDYYECDVENFIGCRLTDGVADTATQGAT